MEKTVCHFLSVSFELNVTCCAWRWNVRCVNGNGDFDNKQLKNSGPAKKQSQNLGDVNKLDPSGNVALSNYLID